MDIRGLSKTTLLDFPGHVAATIFTGGCNFRCPFCHNGDLVLGGNGNIVIFVGKIDIIFCQPWKLGLELEALAIVLDIHVEGLTRPAALIE